MPPQGGLDVRPAEAREGDDSSTPNCRHVAEGLDDGSEAAPVADRAEGRDGRLPAERVAMRARELRQPGGRPPKAEPAGRMCRGLDYPVVGVVEQRFDLRSRHPASELARVASHPRVGIPQKRRDVGRVRPAQPDQRRQRGDADEGVAVPQRLPDRSHVAHPTGERDLAPPARRVGRARVRSAQQATPSSTIPASPTRSTDAPGTHQRARGRLRAMSDGSGTAGEAATVLTPPPAAASRRAPGRRLLRRTVVAAIALVACCLVAAFVAALVPVPYYAITPGSGVDVEGLVSVPHGLARAHLGSVLLADVELVPLRALSYLYYKLDANADVVPTGELLGTASSSQYERQGEIDMANARQAAVVVAMDELGYKVRAIPDGVIVYQPEGGSPAANGLAVGDVVDSLDGRPVRTLLGLESALGSHRPGDLVSLGLRGMFSSTQRSVQLRLGELRVKGTGQGATEICAAPGADASLQPFEENGSPAPCLGIIGAEQAYATRGLPFKVSLSSDGIVGPSAALPLPLGLIEKPDPSYLTPSLR